MNRVTMLVGAAEPFGRAILSALLDAGDTVAVVAVDGEASDEIETETDGRAVAFAVDPTDPENVAETFDAVVDAMGAPGAMVLLVEEAQPAWLIDGGAEGVNAAVQHRIVAPLTMVALAAERMEAGAAIALVLPSTGAHSVAKALTGATRGALEGFVRGAATELAVADIRINAVLTGAVDADAGVRPVRRTPLSRPAEPEDVAAAVLFLIADEARGVTGECLAVDGGAGASRAVP
ncbi:SDR family NAD(P)-dependent oxidoreductase [Oharaeibacter diazotrophicus]|uniref:Enoyl-[acyl-carrier-protein] reductase [NADH] n=1 Tax=Oharaeibacter diazotrophicus TaxID=1920512 RepID=A0A4R6RIT7_9HYPH|nr:SDR family oxidoreductase [Oharaeibacter diazotrophicus]TDP86302.1 enoyl-[acyl-carrier-protein] reductase [NADH] [Oharaeibacter diazotrophicus]BBE71755.1 2,5-dichloro-2,5-cyclohexadiene-1,4-diol dehydrogenase [Pleomorphomonas sp. SM30]GLS78521.1 3-ketoacyl-ACP reductase [Oharaeibacter diazotrophicus]